MLTNPTEDLMLNEHRESFIATISGGEKKGDKRAIMKLLMESGHGFRIGRSVTTRDRCETDIKGEYEYIHPKAFAEARERQEFQWDWCIGHVCYGTRKTFVAEAFKSEKVFLISVVPDVVQRFLDIAGPERLISFLIQSPRDEELSKQKIPFIPVPNPDEEIRGKTAAGIILHALHGFGQF